MRIRSAACVSALLAGTLLHPGPAHAQSAEDRAAARATAQAGLKAMDEKRWTDAVDLFVRAESLMHAPTILLNLARSYVQVGKLVQAQEAYSQVAHETLAANASQPFVQAQADAQRELDALRPRIPTLTLNVANAPPSLAVTMDGEKLRAAVVGLPFPVNPGKHTLRVSADGMAPAEATVTLKEGGHESPSLALVPLPPSAAAASGGGAGEGAASAPPAANTGLSGMQIAGIGVGAAGVVGLVLGGVFGGMAFSAKNQQVSDCSGPGNCPDSAGALSEHNTVSTDATVSTVAFIAGGVLLAGGVTLFFIGRPTQEAKPVALSIAPVVAPGVAFASLRGEF